ncbi:hypothetical protein [Streptomyces sp. NBC_00582]|uniref:hypothetical protein n=1 Tax=Streptomyces sp. NBC_00582 TaxID=2975783 RepID=UPI002E80A740|nr:hypothetical protein [Streptomyces sp. NBC_00582]WUB60440.1 hypothetical protein OG852_08610 [Streptomyces sp. NBC_00582]
MKYAVNSPISLTPAPEGWWVQHTAPDGTKSKSRIVAWAVVATGADDDGSMNTTVEPVFVEHGTLWTRSEWWDVMGTEHDVEVIEP